MTPGHKIGRSCTPQLWGLKPLGAFGPDTKWGTSTPNFGAPTSFARNIYFEEPGANTPGGGMPDAVSEVF